MRRNKENLKTVAVEKAQPEAEVFMHQLSPSVKGRCGLRAFSLSGRSMSATAETLNNSLEGFVWVKKQ